MSLDTSKTILKVFGYISIVFGVLGILGGIAVIAGGSLIGVGVASGEVQASKDLAAGIAIFGFGGLLILISAAIELMSGVFSVKAAKDISKIMPAWVFSLIGLILSIIQVIMALVQKQPTTSNPITIIIGHIVGIGISALIFVAANNIKQAAGK